MPAYNGRSDYGEMPYESIDISFFGRTGQSRYWIGVDENLYYISDLIFNDIDPLELFPNMYENMEFRLVDFKALKWECELYATDETERDEGKLYIRDIFFALLPKDKWLKECLYLSSEELSSYSNVLVEIFNVDFTLYGNISSQIQDIIEDAIGAFNSSSESYWEEYTDYDRYSGEPYGPSGRFSGNLEYFYVPFFIEGKGDGEEEYPYRLYRIQ